MTSNNRSSMNWLRKAGALVPLAVLSVSWTASLAGVGPAAAPSAAQRSASDLLATPVPAQSLEAPASVSPTDEVGSISAPAERDAQQIVATSTSNAIPYAAVSAYQRAESVINSADEGCNLTWQLIAAIGRVESNHGRFGGNALDDDGIAQPGIYGIALDGTNNTSVIRDTDAAQFDNDPVYDRAVGPMQFIPSTWSVVGVDADGDGQRNPQDIDDAALATAVYLCSGTQPSTGDLSATAGQRSAVYRYNHSQDYVDLVLSIMDAYLDGDFTSIPNNTSAAGLLVPSPPDSDGEGGRDHGGQGPPRATYNGEPFDPAQPPESTETEPHGGDDGEGRGDEDGNDGEVRSPTADIPHLPATPIKPVNQVLTLAQAILRCTLDGLLDNPLTGNDSFDRCVGDLTSMRS